MIWGVVVTQAYSSSDFLSGIIDFNKNGFYLINQKSLSK